MKASADPGLVKRLSVFASGASVFSIAVGVAGLAGWKFHVLALTTWGADPVTMKANTAFCFVLAGVSLWLLRKKGAPSVAWLRKAAGNGVAAFTGLLGALSLVEAIFRWNLGIDQLLVVAPSGLPADSPAPGLMSPIAGGAFFLLSLALVGIDWRTGRGHWPAQFLSLAAGTGATLSLFAFAFDPRAYAAHISLALPTAVAFLAVSWGLIGSRTEWGLGMLLSSRSLSGSIARRLLPATFIPAAVGWLRWQIAAGGIYSEWNAVVLVSLIALALMIAIAVWAASAVGRYDVERQRIEQALDASEEQLDRLLRRTEEPKSEKRLRRRVEAGFVIAALLTVLLGVLSWRNAQRAAQEAALVAHAHEVSTTLELTLRHLVDVETGARGFVVTGDKVFLEPYDRGRIVVDQDLQRLSLLILDPEQKRRLNVLAEQAHVRIKAAGDLVASRQNMGPVADEALPLRGKQLMDAARATIEQMEAGEEQLLEQRSQQARSAQRFANSAIALGSILGAVFLSAAGFTVSREIGVSARARAQVNAINADLERRVSERTEALGESEGRLAGVIQSAMDAILTVDEQQNIVMFNGAAERVFRCPAAEALGQPVTRFIPQRFHAAHAGHIHRFADTGVTNRTMGPKNVLWAVRADGEEFQIEASISQVVTGGKKLFTVILRDVTERVRTEAVREHLAAVVDSSDDAIISKDLNGTINAWNRGAEKIFGYTAAEAMAKSMLMIFPPELVPEEADILARIGRGESVEHHETVRVRKDGSRIDVSVTISPIRDASGAIVGASKIARDITERIRTQEALRQSDLRRGFALDTAKIGDWDLDLTTLQATRSALHDQIFGYPTPLPEWNFEIFLRHVHADDREHVRETFQSSVRQKKKSEFECRIVHPNGDIRWIWACGDQNRDASGKATRMFGIVQDITERKKIADSLSLQTEELLRSQQSLESQTLMLQSVLDSISEGLVAADETGKFILWNPAATRIVGMGAENVPPGEWNQHYGVYLPDTVTPFPPEQNPLLRAIGGEACVAEMYLHNQELESGVWIETSASPLKNRDGVVSGGVIAIRDITQRRLDEQKIHQLNDELEERVVQRTAQLEAANQELEAFTYSVSHDLRAPLRHIGGFSKILSEDFGPSLPEEAQGHLQRIEDGVHRMGLLVDELLNLARVGRHALELQSVELNSIIEEVVSLLQPEVNGRVVTWKIANLLPAQCDPILIKQVFQNLIDNALKFTRTRERAVIEISQRQETGETVIAVSDNGVGFSMKYKDKLFGVFQRLHRAEDFEGTGIGLATVQRIVRKHGGRVWAEAEPDKGATFYFTLGTAEKSETRPEGVRPDEKAISQAAS